MAKILWALLHLAILLAIQRSTFAAGTCATNFYGGTGGSFFSDQHAFIAGGEGRISGFQVRYGRVIDCFGLYYRRGSARGKCHGGTGGQYRRVMFDPDEFITGITGRSGRVIDQLAIYTNKDTYGPYGRDGGRPFYIEHAGDEVAYIEGRSGRLLDKIRLIYHC